MVRIFILAFALICASSFAQQGLPDTLPLAPGEKATVPSFAGIPMGCTVKEAQDIMSKAGIKLVSKEKDKYNSNPDTWNYNYAGNSVLNGVESTELSFYKGKLIQTTVSFEKGKSNLAAIISSLKEKYGEPTNSKESSVQGGAALTLSWENKDQVNVSFSSHVGDVFVFALYLPLFKQRNAESTGAVGKF